ncbi:MAG: hypothetical protein ACLGH0_10785 [Thermoanaerobaculia bacterium]
MTAAEYVHEISLLLDRGYPADCVTHACRIAELLHAEGRAPWIGRVRHVTNEGEHVMHWPLAPVRFAGRAPLVWNTHYVAAAGREVYDPLIGQPIDVDAYVLEAFGKQLAVETFLDAEATARLLRDGSLKSAFRVRV